MYVMSYVGQSDGSEFGQIRMPVQGNFRSTDREPVPAPGIGCGVLLSLGLCVLLVCFCRTTEAQISPGPLAKAHQSLNGPNNCTKCHSVNTHTPSFRCVECHQEIAAELQQHKGLHATYPQTGAPGAACVKCHSDHNGEDFSLLHWNPTPKGFDHSKTGYTLDGKHASVGCRSSHQASHVVEPWRSLLATKNISQTWLGLSTNCISCHQDQHQGRLGTNCTQCHSTSDWKGAKIDTHAFDHSKTRYPLTGQHQSVACEKCHTAGADGQPKYSGLAFATCSSCHLLRALCRYVPVTRR